MATKQSMSLKPAHGDIKETKAEASSSQRAVIMLKCRKSSRNPADGSVVLGKGTDTPYVTRYRIVKEKQREIMQEDMMTQMTPCCYASDRKCSEIVWQCVKSEPFLLTLHISALVLSVLKGTMPDVDIDQTLELVHSCLETLVAAISLAIRIAAGREKFHQEKVVRNELEFCPDSVRTLTLKRAMWIFYTIGASLILFLLATLGALITIDKLHWTIVTTNFALIIGGIGGNLTLQRLEGMVNKIRDDQHKAIIYESLLLLKACTGESEQTDLAIRVKKFSDCVENTELFKNKGHIEYQADSQFIASNWNVPALLSLQSTM